MACCCSIISLPMTCTLCGKSIGLIPDLEAETGFWGLFPVITISLRIFPFLFLMVSKGEFIISLEWVWSNDEAISCAWLDIENNSAIDGSKIVLPKNLEKSGFKVEKK